MVGVPQKRKAVRHLISCHSISERRACGLVGIARSSFRYEHTRDSQDWLRARIKEIALSRIRYGYKRIHVQLRREGYKFNKKRVHRLYCLYCLEGLQLRPKRPRRNVSGSRRYSEQKPATAINESWAMDFVADQLHDGRKIRILTIIDTFSRECLATTTGPRLRSEDVVRTLNQILVKRGAPKKIFCDNGSEFAGRITDLWAYTNKVTLAFSRPGKPTDNAFIESFNGNFRDECLNCDWFTSYEDAKVKIESWRNEYNSTRPHSALNNLSPLEYVAQQSPETCPVS